MRSPLPKNVPFSVKMTEVGTFFGKITEGAW
jgi:hypothetical protein